MRTFVAVAVLALLVGCASSATTESEETYKRGLSVANSDTAGAIKIFEEGLQADPKHYRMRFALARLQFDTGETQHLAEREAIGAARGLEDQHRVADAQKAQKEAQDRHQKALPFYRAARENLLIVADRDNDEARQAWAWALIAKCDVFFEEYDVAADHLQKAIDLGRPAGAKLAAMKEFLQALKKEAGKRKKPNE